VSNRLILALDGMTFNQAEPLVRALGPLAYAVKVHDMVDNEGRQVISMLKTAGAQNVWVDYKLHDIPKTVGRRAQALKDSRADIVTVHASGGAEMVRAAVDTGIEVYAVTVLTSLSARQAVETYAWTDAESAVLGLAMMALEGGAHGIVCSGQEAAILHKRKIDSKGDFKIVVPGTRSAGVAAKGQKRSTTPREALDVGATHLVIASQVTEADDPIAAWQNLVAEIQEGDEKR